MSMFDSFAKTVRYIRIGVTPRFDLRQSYQAAIDGKPFLAGDSLLAVSEIARLARIYAAQGLRKIRLTGGEPLMRGGICRLIRELKSTAGIEEVAISTNGILLPEMIPELQEAGLDAISISLETLRRDRFDKIAGPGGHAKVMAAIRQVVEDNIWPLTINMVPIRGVNSDEVIDFADMAHAMPVEIRFIEMMPEDFDVDQSTLIPFYMDEVEHETVKKHTLIPVDGREERTPSSMYGLKGGLGRMRFVSPISSHSCENCHRLRITADGMLRTCLFNDHDIDLRPGFKNRENDGWFLDRLHDALKTKPYSGKPGPQTDVYQKAEPSPTGRLPVSH